MIIKFKADSDLIIRRENGYVELDFRDDQHGYDSLQNLKDAIMFPDFKVDFKKYVEAAYGRTDICWHEGSEAPVLWGKLFALFSKSSSMDDGEWTTLGYVYYKALENRWIHMCGRCGNVFLSTSSLVDIDGKTYCPDCAEKCTAVCCMCDKEYPLADLKPFNLKEHICKDCAERGLRDRRFVIVDRNSFD